MIELHPKPRTTMSKHSMKWDRQPVAVVLNDGSHYVGWITDMNEETLTLTGRKGQGKIKKTSLPHREKAKISAFLPGNQAFNAADAGGWIDRFGFAPAGQGLPSGGGTGWGGFMGFMRQVWPGIQIGWGIVRAVMPLMRRFRL